RARAVERGDREEAPHFGEDRGPPRVRDPRKARGQEPPGRGAKGRGARPFVTQPREVGIAKWGSPPMPAGVRRSRVLRAGNEHSAGKESTMPRYMVERTFTGGLEIPVNAEGAQVCLGVVGRNADLGVTWVHSYVSEDKKKTFCIYDAPSPEAVRKAA